MPIGPSSTFCRCSIERNRNGIASTFIAGTIVADQRHIGAIEIDGAGAGLLDGFLFLAELAGMEHPDLVPAAAALRDQAAHEAQRLHGRIVLGLGIGGAEFARKRARRRRRQQQRGNEHHGPLKVGAAGHRQHLP